jgi:hypothetical protein
MYCQLTYTQTATACTGAPGQCAPGYCNTTAMKCMMPSGGTCENKIANGTACDPNNTGGFAAFVENQCVDGTACLKLPAQTAYTCQPLSSAAAACTSDGDCKLGLFCNMGTCTSWFSDAQACTSGNDCSSSACIADNADAGTTKTCQQVKSVGVACIPGFEDSLCAPADLPGTSACLGAPGTVGACAPKCNF